MSFIEELKRRNIVRVAIVYWIAAWLLIQIAVVIFPALRLPEWTVTLVTALCFIGFPLALIFAWALELTPEGIKLEKDVALSGSLRRLTSRKLDFIIIVMLTVALGYFALDKFAMVHFESDSAQVNTSSIVTHEQQRSIAVLPFVNLSDDPGNEYFAEGMSDEIRSLLGRIPELKVIGRTSSHVFKGNEEDVRSIGDALGVSIVLEGSVRKSGDRIRIATQLVNTRDGAQLWSDSYDRIVIDVFEVQDAVAADIISALRIHIGAPPSRGQPTENSAAYTLFLKGKAAINALDYQAALVLINEAIILDPRFAEAFETLAFLYWMTADTRHAVESQELVRVASAKAIELDPDLAFAKIYARSTNLGSEYRKGTVEALDQAIRYYPDNTKILEPLTWLLVQMGYLAESRRLAEHYLRVDPLSPVAHSYLALGKYSTGRVDEAIDAAQFVLRSPPTLNSDTWAVVGMLLAENHSDAAIKYVESALDAQAYSGPAWFREVVTNARDPIKGQTYLDQRIPEITAVMAGKHSLRWEEELLALYLFFGYLDRYYEVVFETEPTDQTWHYAGIHAWRGSVFHNHGFTGHRLYLELAGKLSIDDVWEQRGPPDYCNNVGREWSCR